MFQDLTPISVQYLCICVTFLLGMFDQRSGLAGNRLFFLLSVR
jgi:hypothetical protein